MNNMKFVWGGILIAMVIAMGGYLYPKVQGSFGSPSGETNYNTLGISGLKVGSNCGDSFRSTAANGCKSTAHLIVTTCSPILDNSITASSTGYGYCTGVTGVTSSDSILAQFSTSTLGYNAWFDDWYIVSAKASSTAGAIDLLVYNGSGRNQAPSANSRTGSTTVLQAFQ